MEVKYGSQISIKYRRRLHLTLKMEKIDRDTHFQKLWHKCHTHQNMVQQVHQTHAIRFNGLSKTNSYLINMEHHEEEKSAVNKTRFGSSTP